MTALLLRYWYIAAIAAVAAWGGLGWYGKAGAERAFAEYQREAAETISKELLHRQAAAEQQQQLAREASDSYQKGAANVRKALQPSLDELTTLRVLWAARPDPDGLRQPAETGPGALPATPEPPGRPHATACTDRPGAIAAAAERVAKELATCAADLERLKGLQKWAAGLGD